MTLAREPARPHDPGYPTFAGFDPARRAALRAIALAGLSAAGLQLVGCPGGGGTGPRSGPLDWLPWRGGGPGRPDDIPLAGAPPPTNFGQPVAIVVGGGPIDVEFSDGRTAKLAVALVVQPTSSPLAVKAGAPEHVAAVKAAAKALPGSTCDSVQGLEALQAKIQDEVLKATPGLILEGVQAAPAAEPPPAEPQAPREAAGAPAPAAAPSAPAAAPSAPSAPPTPTRAPLTGNRVWVPCAKPGCTSCGTK